jgi:hypothetical protein
VRVDVKAARRDDVQVVKVPRTCVGYITGARGQSLRETEKKSGTFCFINDGNHREGDTEELLIFA